jgi:hypothetical protein
MEWIKPTVKNEFQQSDTRAHDFTLLIGDKLLVFNFEDEEYGVSEKHLIDCINLGTDEIFYIL